MNVSFGAGASGTIPIGWILYIVLDNPADAA